MRVGIMSFAHLHAEGYIETLRALPGVEFIGFADEDADRGAHFAQRYAAPYFDSYDALLAHKPDAVIVCSENARHTPLVQMAAEAGVHVLCEKPLATSLADAQAIVDVCARHRVTLMTAFPMRFSTPMLEVKALLEAGTLGTVYGCNATNQGECPQHHRAWFVDKALAGGGAFMDHIVHLADAMRWLLGTEVVEVYAQANRILYADVVPPDVETGGLVMLTFANGMFASIDCSWSKPPYYPTWGGLAMDIVSENGLVTMNAFKQIMTVYRHSLGRPQYAYWGSDANRAMIEDFISAVRDARPPRVTGEDGLRAVEIVLAAYESSTSGQPVRL